MSYDPNRDPNSGYGNPPYGVPPQGAYNQPPNPYEPPPQGPYGTPQGPYGPPPQGPYNQPQGPYGAPPYSQPQSPYGYPPQGPYGAPPYQQPDYGYAAPPAAPLPLGEAIRQLPQQYIKVLTKPSAATFAEEMGKGNWGVIWIQLIGLAIIQAVSNFITNYIRNSISPNPQDPAYLLGQSIGESIILLPLFFFIGQGLLYLLAKAFGGQGIFRAQSYTTLLVYVPITIISVALALILIPARAFPPLLLILALVLVIVALALLAYDIVLQTYSVMAVHRLSGGKAAASVLISIGVLLLLVLCGSLIIGLAAAGARPH